MNVIFIAPGYPDEMPFFVRGLTRYGGSVFGVSDVPANQLPPLTREHLSGYLQCADMTDEMAVVGAVTKWMGRRTIDRVVCMWEPGVVLAARMREALGVPGQDIEQALRFRDKDLMKQHVRAAGIRCARHARASTMNEVRAACEQVGYPAIVKPIDGAGSMDTFKVNNAQELELALKRLTHVNEVNVEEFIEGEEYTYDTICVNGEMKYRNIGYYRPNPLIARSNEWISPQTLCLRHSEDEQFAGAHKLGQDVIDAMQFQTGFTHMEWFMTNKGEAVFSEIAARPPGARTVDLMNYVSDHDLFDGWAEAELTGNFSPVTERLYTSANIFKRAIGRGRIQRIEGLADLMKRYGEHVVNVDLLPIGAMRRDWIMTLISDGYITIRHPDFAMACEIADAFGTDLRLYAS
jgi:hypothetical protein